MRVEKIEGPRERIFFERTIIFSRLDQEYKNTLASTDLYRRTHENHRPSPLTIHSPFPHFPTMTRIGDAKKLTRRHGIDRHVIRVFLFLIAVLWFAVSGLWLSPSSSSSSARQSSLRNPSSAAIPAPISDSKDLIITLELQLDQTTNTSLPVEIHIKLFQQETPDATRFITDFIKQQNEQPSSTIYRGEPVPDYWGSSEYPDRWHNGGRWGPPYALIQGAFDSLGYLPNAMAEDHRPEIKRSHVAWAGGKGGPHFFIALADHPEWKHSHTVFGRVENDDDMSKLDALVNERPLITNKKSLPWVTNFVQAIKFRVKWG